MNRMNKMRRAMCTISGKLIGKCSTVPGVPPCATLFHPVPGAPRNPTKNPAAKAAGLSLVYSLLGHYLFFNSSIGTSGLSTGCTFSVTIVFARLKETVPSIFRDDEPIFTLYSPASAIHAD